MSDTRRFCPQCRVVWSATIGESDWCPYCHAESFFTMNVGDMGAAMYLRETGESLERFTAVEHPVELGSE